MKTTIFSIALVLGFAFATPSYDGGRRSDDDRDGHRHRDHCLSQQDVDSILSRWPRIFDGGQAGVDLITKTVTEDFTSYNEGFNFGNVTGPEIDVQGRAVLMTIQQHAVANKGNSDGKFSTVLEFHTGDKIAWRWQFIGQTNGDRW